MLSCFSHVRFFATLCTVAHQAPLSIGFFKQEYWRGLLFLSPGDLPGPGIEPTSPALADRFFTTEQPGKPSTGAQMISFDFSFLSSVLPTGPFV